MVPVAFSKDAARRGGWTGLRNAGAVQNIILCRIAACDTSSKHTGRARRASRSDGMGAAVTSAQVQPGRVLHVRGTERVIRKKRRASYGAGERLARNHPFAGPAAAGLRQCEWDHAKRE